MPPADFWDEDEEFYSHTDRISSAARHVRPPRRARDDNYGRRSDFLTPEHHTTYSSGLHRTRSQGHSPAPNINIYATSRLENESSPKVHTEQKSRDPSPANPRGRPMRMQEEWALEDQLAEIRMELAKTRRSRSRSAHYHRNESPARQPAHNAEYDRWQLQQANERLKEADERAALERREDSLRKKLELKHLKEKLEREEEDNHAKAEHDRIVKEMELKYEREERERSRRAREAEEERKRIIAENTAKIERAKREEEDERERIIAENTLRMEREARERKASQQAAVDAFNKKRAEEEAEAKAAQLAAVDAFNKKKAEDEKNAKEERERIVAEYERKKFLDEEQAKRERERVIMELRIEEEKRKAKEKEEYERFLHKQKMIEEEEKAKAQKQEEELNEAMRKRLAQFGFQDNQIQAMIRPEDAARIQQQQQPLQQQLQAGSLPVNPLRLTHQPTYVKVHKDHLAVDTLHYYEIPYEVDKADPNFIIILREMDTRETELLFEHTRRLRTRGTSRLLIEEQRRDHHDRPEYAWVRRRAPSRSPSRRRSSPKRVVGISDMFLR